MTIRLGAMMVGAVAPIVALIKLVWLFGTPLAPSRGARRPRARASFDAPPEVPTVSLKPPGALQQLLSVPFGLRSVAR